MTADCRGGAALLSEKKNTDYHTVAEAVLSEGKKLKARDFFSDFFQKNCVCLSKRDFSFFLLTYS